jgi:hypothetical protein
MFPELVGERIWAMDGRQLGILTGSLKNKYKNYKYGIIAFFVYRPEILELDEHGILKVS